MCPSGRPEGRPLRTCVLALAPLEGAAQAGFEIHGRRVAEQAVDALFHSMKEALTRGERIELRGFGVFVVKPRKRGVGRNPRTGEEVAIPSGKTIRFKPGKDLQVSEDGELSTDIDADDDDSDF